MDYQVLAYYLFTPIELPAREVFNHKKFFNCRDATGRIYISEEGINGQMCASPEAAQEYMQWLKSDPRFAEVEFKIHTWHEHCFPRMTIKLRAQLAALDRKVDMEKTGEHVSPEEWKKMLEARTSDTVLIDVRNDYEWDIGHFEGAELPALGKFRDFPAYAQKLKETKDPKKTKVMMYCTGGIRCELYSALMKEEGFEHIYQLQGGVIKYGLKEGSKHWKGKLFVFDDRLAVSICDEETEVIGRCSHCDAPTDFYFNCANMGCNNLFLSCQACAEKMKGCCCSNCESAPFMRPFIKQDRPKPFRRKHLCGISS
jgi:UPF0176 protein